MESIEEPLPAGAPLSGLRLYCLRVWPGAGLAKGIIQDGANSRRLILCAPVQDRTGWGRIRGRHLVGDAISIVESVHESAIADHAWLAGICRESPAWLEEWPLDNENPVGTGLVTWEAIMAALLSVSEPTALRALFTAQELAALRERLDRAGIPPAPFLNRLEPFGVSDSPGVPFQLLDGASGVVGIGLSTVRPGGAPERGVWSRIATQTAAKPAGAKEVLRAAARAIDGARLRMRREDPDGAFDLWKALVAGRWSLVDSFESDGRRYLLARRNDPRAPARAPLTEREAQVAVHAALGHSNKRIGYEVGLSTSTVGAHLAAAQRKLGVRSRLELVEVVRRLQRS
jgi:DNA-binding CsgD family transcriptional regulator